MTMNHDALLELTEAYVLGGLAADERRAVEAHLRACVECSAHVSELLRVGEGLGRLVDQREPPAHLRARVLDTIARTAPAARENTARPRPARSAPLWLAVAASIAAVALGLYAAALRSESSRLERALAESRARNARAELELVQLREAAGTAARVRSVLVAADLSQAELRGQTPSPEARGRAYWSRSAGVLFNASGLPALPAGKVYQLWIVTQAAPVSLGLVTPDAAGRATLAAEMPSAVVPVQIALTIEPAGGVPAPTGAVYLAGPA